MAYFPLGEKASMMRNIVDNAVLPCVIERKNSFSLNKAAYTAASIDSVIKNGQ